MYDNLYRHPQIQDLPGKELRFWSGKRSPQEKERRIGIWIRNWRRKYANSPDQMAWGLKWLERYSRADDDLEIYLSLFDAPGEKLVGDMSVNLCRIPPAEVRDIRRKLGDIPVFLLARDPIERDWSDAQLMLQHHKSRVQQSDDAYIKYISSIQCQQYSNYIRIIDLWTGFFTKFMIFYFDDIQQRPHRLMRDVCRFLNIDPKPSGFRVQEVAPNPTSVEIGKFARTPAIYEAQKRISEPLMAEQKARLGGHAAAWYDRHFGGTPMPLEVSLAAGIKQG
jgi:hypothetical protein